jgi:hypothetical protein
VAVLTAACDASGTVGGGADVAAQVSSASTVQGTIQATIDGTARTWYVVTGTSQGRPYASGVWQEMVPTRRTIILGGYETATPPLDTFLWEKGMPRSYGVYTGSTLLLMLEVGAAPAPYRATLPGAEGTTVLYANPAKLDALDTTFMLRQGQVDVSAVSINGGLASTAGTFSGTLALMAGDGATVAVTDGRFEVKGMPDLATITPHWSSP